MRIPPLVLTHCLALLLFVTGSQLARGAETYPATEAGAKALLTEFLKPGADVKSLSKPLQPTKADYEAVYEAAFAQKLQAMYEPAWTAGVLVLAPKAGQTELMLQSVPTSEIRAWSPKASAALPGGYQQVATDIKDGGTIYAFKFVKPGEQLGMAFDGLTNVNGHWCIIPKPWRAAQAK